MTHPTTDFTANLKEEEILAYLFPSALCYHVTAGKKRNTTNQRQADRQKGRGTGRQADRQNQRERERQREKVKGGSESTLGASEEAIFFHRDWSTNKNHERSSKTELRGRKGKSTEQISV